MFGGQPLPSCRTSNLNPPCLTSRRTQPPLIFRATSAIFVADRPEGIIRPEIAQNAAEGDVARPGGIVVCLINTGDLAIFGLFGRFVAKTAVSCWNGRLFRLDVPAV